MTLCVYFSSFLAVTNFIMLATTAALPGGARNTEYAHHCLQVADGDIEVRNPNPTHQDLPLQGNQDQPGTPLKTLDTFGNCHRPVFSLAVSQHMHKITNL